ncbi:MAG: hypothetical protein AAGJ86_04390 [Pseudomonadota bacterium]
MSTDEHDAKSKAQVEAIGIPDGEPAFLNDPLQDKLLEAAITLGGELWIERERRMQLEAVLVAKGLISAEDIESFEPDEQQVAERKASLDALVKRLFEPLTDLPGAPNNS